MRSGCFSGHKEKQLPVFVYYVDNNKADAAGSLHRTAREAAVTDKVRFCKLQEVKNKTNKKSN